MKILDKYILKSFIITFSTVFVILFLIFILQTVWLFIGELAGKDLDLVLIFKFLLFKMPSIVPLVLPLSIVLASIMTFGSFAENYEFAAMKSAGISLQRAMRGLSIFILLLAIASFAFANNVIPYAEYKFINFRRNIAQVKPAMAIAEGQFSDIGNYNIKVDKKSGDNGNLLSGVTIHKKSTRDLSSNSTVIRARSGELVSNEDSNILKLILRDGYYYEDIIPKKHEERKKMPFAKSSFKQYVINIDLSMLNKTNLDEEQITNTNTMLNVGELTYTLDSLDRNYEREVISFTDNIYQRTGIVAAGRGLEKRDPNFNAAVPENLLSLYSPTERAEILKVARGNVMNTNFTIDGSRFDLESKIKNINNHWIALHDKFVIAYACFLMFFIGAPLGAIIRKGGLGLPIVFAVLVFIVFHFINTFGKKVAQENGISPFLGTWMSSIVLTPFAVMLTYRATNDKQITFDFDWLTVPLKKMFGKSKTEDVTADQDRIVNLNVARISSDEDYLVLQGLETDILIEMVYNAARQSLPEVKRLQVLKVLDERGITQEDLVKQGKLFNREYELLRETVESYRMDANLTLFLFFLAAILVLVFQNNTKLIWVVIPAFVVLIGFYFSLLKSAQRLKRISRLTGIKVGWPKWLTVLTGMPFYIFQYFLNRRALRSALRKSSL